MCSPTLSDLASWALILQQRLAKWFTTLSPKEKAKIIKDVSQLVLARRTRMCNFLEYKGALHFLVQGLLLKHIFQIRKLSTVDMLPFFSSQDVRRRIMNS
jgi:hypothetical protein